MKKILLFNKILFVFLIVFFNINFAWAIAGPSIDSESMTFPSSLPVEDDVDISNEDDENYIESLNPDDYVSVSYTVDEGENVFDESGEVDAFFAGSGFIYNDDMIVVDESIDEDKNLSSTASGSLGSTNTSDNNEEIYNKKNPETLPSIIMNVNFIVLVIVGFIIIRKSSKDKFFRKI